MERGGTVGSPYKTHINGTWNEVVGNTREQALTTTSQSLRRLPARVSTLRGRLTERELPRIACKRR